jgi:hypothetical protein
MAKRLLSSALNGHLLASPGLHEAPVLDLMCSHLVLTLTTRPRAAFNVRRDLKGIVGLAARHLVWPNSMLLRLRAFLSNRCAANALWRGHEALDAWEFLARFGLWHGPYDEATLFFFLDEYAKDQPKDLLSVLDYLCLGDFAAVKRQMPILGTNITPLEFLEQLEAEHRIKPEVRQLRPMGLMQ